MKKLFLSLFIFASFANAVVGQDKEKPADDLTTLSLEELMNVKITSASKKEETLFDAPLSSFTVTKADIDRSGVISIMEALRLAPGVIVREVTNGIYDIHIRGLDNVTRVQPVNQKGNYATLIMIDNRPVYNPITGGTFWEALPVDINDVERIEIVRGPAAPLFGPNAVSGVINIITKRATGESLNVFASAQGGNYNTGVYNATIGQQFKKWNFNASVNYQHRGKYDGQYYSISQSKFVDPSNLAAYVDPSSGQIFPLGSDFLKNLPHPETSWKHLGFNTYIGYRFSEKTNLDISAGLGSSDAQKIYAAGVPDTYFNASSTQGRYMNLLFNSGGLKFRGSVNSTSDDSNYGGTNLGYARLVTRYDYILSDVVAEYDVKLSNNFKVSPGVSYQAINFDDTKYHDNVTSIGLFNGKPSLNNYSMYLRSDGNINALRIVAALRMDKFSSPDHAYFNYELAATYKLNETNLFRFGVTRSNSGSYISYNYINLVIQGTPIFTGNRDLKLFTIDMQEIGFRSKLSKDMQLDIDIFRQQANNLTQSLQNTFTNSQLVPTQYGVTASLNYLASEKIQFRPFITLQTTSTANVPNGWNSNHTNTPSYYGGYYLNYVPTQRFNVNINGYYFASQRQYDQYDPTNANPIGNINGKIITNLKVSYSILKSLNVFLNARNALNATSREFYAADQTHGLYLVGASFRMN
jgi:iron complex outermembrane receptor protein